MKSREELKEIARQILDYRRFDHAQLMSSLNEEELRELTPLIREVSNERVAEIETKAKREREEYQAEKLERLLDACNTIENRLLGQLQEVEAQGKQLKALQSILLMGAAQGEA